jgi:glycosyltransferase involved in cell wall biosynthesis
MEPPLDRLSQNQGSMGKIPVASAQPLRIALVAPPFLPVPPPRYGGTERIVGELAQGLHRRGHDVTVFASGDSTAPGRLIPVVPRSTWASASRQDTTTLMRSIVDQVEERADQFDLISSHIEWFGFGPARRSPVPFVTTLHGRIDIGPTAVELAQYRDIPLVAISDKQRSFWPDQNWLATIHHGLNFEGIPRGNGSGGYLLFVGRLTPEKGVDAAVELARRTRLPLLVAAKAMDAHEIQHYHDVVEPAERDGTVIFLGEVGPPARDRLFGDALATVMLGDWPEPFGLVAVESLATGTPLVARRAGALPEIVRDGVDGFIVDTVEEAAAVLPDLARLDRAAIREGTLRRFSAARMIDDYERLFREVARPQTPPERKPRPSEEEEQTSLVVP